MVKWKFQLATTLRWMTTYELSGGDTMEPNFVFLSLCGRDVETLLRQAICECHSCSVMGCVKCGADDELWVQQVLW